MTTPAATLDQLIALGERTPKGPWRIEEDWTAELFDAEGNLLGKIIYPSGLAAAHFIAAARCADTLARELKDAREALRRIAERTEAERYPSTPMTPDDATTGAEKELCGAGRGIRQVGRLGRG